jgi:hypothetical protein
LKQCQAFAWLRSARQWRGCEGREDHYMGSPVIRYDSALLSAMLGDSFALIETRRHDHRTSLGGIQRFQFSVFRYQ